MNYQVRCLSCGCKITDPGDEEPVPGTSDPIRYRHKDYTGCSKALNAKPARTARARVPRHSTLSQVENRPDNPWTRRR